MLVPRIRDDSMFPHSDIWGTMDKVSSVESSQGPINKALMSPVQKASLAGGRQRERERERLRSNVLSNAAANWWLTVGMWSYCVRNPC
jgi:hypothetical protein